MCIWLHDEIVLNFCGVTKGCITDDDSCLPQWMHLIGTTYFFILWILSSMARTGLHASRVWRAGCCHLPLTSQSTSLWKHVFFCWRWCHFDRNSQGTVSVEINPHFHSQPILGTDMRENVWQEDSFRLDLEQNFFVFRTYVGNCSCWDGSVFTLFRSMYIA